MASPFLSWILLVAALGVMEGVGAQVVLNEVMYDPRGAEHHDEYVELLNSSQTLAVDLSGWQLGDADELDDLVDTGMGWTLQPGQFALVLDGSYFGNSATYANVLDDVLLLKIADRSFGRTGWSNSGEEAVILRNAAGDTVETFRYWPEKSPGFSWEKVDPSSLEWELARVQGGTPGRLNSVYELRLFDGTGPEIELIPNPFSDQLVLNFRLPSAPALLTIWVYDVEGRRIRELAASIEVGPSGQVLWDGRDDAGRSVAAGMYILYLEVSVRGSIQRLKKVIVRRKK